MTLAQLIRLNRQKLGISQLELAEKLGVSQAAIGQWEREVTAPRSKNFPELAKIFGIDVEQIVAASEELEIYQQAKAESDARKAAVEGRPSMGGIGHRWAGSNNTRSDVERAYFTRNSEEAKRFEDTLFKLLPMMGALGAHHVRFGGEEEKAWVADYVSTNSIIEIKHPLRHSALQTMILQSLWTLTVLRAVTHDQQNFIAIIRLPSVDEWDDEGLAMLKKMRETVQRYASDASVVGYHLLIVETAEEAAKAIVKIEQENLFEDEESLRQFLGGRDTQD
ncbi:helix-turn-helix domain-containing protein [Oxalobacteraceae bacterium OTU3CINTB1]|nr:helix-turn-helix domain-containing protein [Oxalobacteraceae bacterium OTU3CINTB1]